MPIPKDLAIMIRGFRNGRCGWFPTNKTNVPVEPERNAPVNALTMNKITLKLGGKQYEFAYSKDFHLLHKREDDGTNFYPFRSTAYWTIVLADGKTTRTLRKSDVVGLIQKRLGIH